MPLSLPLCEPGLTIRSTLVLLALVDELSRSGELDGYHLLHAARADFQRRLGDLANAERSYTRALELALNDSERRFLEKRLAEVRGLSG